MSRIRVRVRFCVRVRIRVRIRIRVRVRFCVRVRIRIRDCVRIRIRECVRIRVRFLRSRSRSFLRSRSFSRSSSFSRSRLRSFSHAHSLSARVIVASVWLMVIRKDWVSGSGTNALSTGPDIRFTFTAAESFICVYSFTMPKDPDAGRASRKRRTF